RPVLRCGPHPSHRPLSTPSPRHPSLIPPLPCCPRCRYLKQFVRSRRVVIFRVLFRNIEADGLLAEAAGLIRPVHNAKEQPNGAHDLGLPTQVHPDDKTDAEPKDRWEQIPEFFLFSTQVVVEERSSVHSHESNEGTEVQELSTTLIA